MIDSTAAVTVMNDDDLIASTREMARKSNARRGRTHVHDVNRSRLLCRTHNQLLAEQLYGRKFMERLRRHRKEAKAAARSPALPPPETSPRACPGASGQQRLL